MRAAARTGLILLSVVLALAAGMVARGWLFGG